MFWMRFNLDEIWNVDNYWAKNVAVFLIYYHYPNHCQNHYPNHWCTMVVVAAEAGAAEAAVIIRTFPTAIAAFTYIPVIY